MINLIILIIVLIILAPAIRNGLKGNGYQVFIPFPQEKKKRIIFKIMVGIVTAGLLVLVILSIDQRLGSGYTVQEKILHIVSFFVLIFSGLILVRHIKKS